MAKNLVIVESPAKAGTIKKFLGKDYEVLASMGHVRDLPKSKMGIDTQHGYEPQYITIRGKGELLKKLRAAMKKSDKVYLATDPDREGEAISWHLAEALSLQPEQSDRITFNEITKSAVKNAIHNARPINMSLVDAQQARRILDRMVGYSISPLLWKKVKRGLSAGRVQSVALRLVCDREGEISAFIPEEYFTVAAQFNAGKSVVLNARYLGKGNEKTTISTQAQADAILAQVRKSAPKIIELKQSERVKKPPLPFTTSTLQQEAAKHLSMSTANTMRIAQQLYEGMTVKGHGDIGLITYLRTDSVRVSDEAVAASKEYITERYGAAYVGDEASAAVSKRKIQDAHEAIRPTYADLSPEAVKDSLSRDQLRLYKLIWRRFIASRMAAARYKNVSLKIDAAGHMFAVSASVQTFDGFMSVYDDIEEADDAAIIKSSGFDAIAALSTGSKIDLRSVDAEKHLTQAPPHYNEASLVKTLEELGIGRPSTYAPIITTLLGRHYVLKENKQIFMTELGEAVNSIMTKAFPNIVDVNFTVNMEARLDDVEDGSVTWQKIVGDFYPDLETAVAKAEKELENINIKDEESDVVCENCGRLMVIKYGPHGRFLACPGFPECRNTKPLLEKIGVLCPVCGKDIILLNTKKGRRFYGCESGPGCGFVSWQRPTGEKCPDCGKLLVEKGQKAVCMDGECGFSKPLVKGED